MTVEAAKANVARTAHLTAWARELGRLTAGEAANGDYLAGRVLRPHQRALNRAPRLARWLLERGLPGAFGYFNARTPGPRVRAWGCMSIAHAARM